MTDIASLGLEIRSDGVVVATDRLGKFRKEAGLAEAAAGSLKRLATMGLAAVAAGFAAFGVGIYGAVKRMEEMRRLTAQVDQALKNSGNSARTSAGEIEAWADKLEASTGRAAEEIMGVSANLASFGFSRQAFFRSLELADDMSAAWGGDLKQNLEGLARALAEPEKGLAMLTKRGITFTDEQKKMIAGFVQANDLAGAQGVVFDALEAQVKGVAEKGYGGLTKALHVAGKAWEDAFEDLVRGDGKASDLRDTIEDLSSTLSSPEFIGAVMGFGNMIIQVINGIAQVAIGAAKAFQDFLNLINAPGGAAAKWAYGTAAPTERDTARLRTDQSDYEGMLASGEQLADRARVVRLLEETKTELGRREAGVVPVNVDGIVGGLGGQTYDSPDAMWRSMSPGTMGGQTAFNPYEGMTLGGADKDKAAAKAKKAYDEIILSSQQFISQQQLEVQALGMTEEAASRLRHQQDLLNQAANDNINLTPIQTDELGSLATAMASAEEASRRAKETFDFAKDATHGFLTDLRQGLMDGVSFWEAFGSAANNVLDKVISKVEDGLVDALFSMGGAGGGGGGFLSSLLSFIPGFATGTNSAPGGLAWVGEQGPELMNVPVGAKIYNSRQSASIAANQNGAQQSVHVTVGVAADGNGNIMPFVQSVAQSTVGRAAPAIVSTSVSQANKSAPSALARYQQQESGSDYRVG